MEGGIIMFNLFKNLKELKEIQDLVSSESVVVEKDGVKIKINGKMEVEEVLLNPNMDITKQQKILRDCLNDGLKKMQMSLVTKLAQNKLKMY